MRAVHFRLQEVGEEGEHKQEHLEGVNTSRIEIADYKQHRSKAGQSCERDPSSKRIEAQWGNLRACLVFCVAA